MDTSQILQEVKKIFIDVLDDNGIVLTEDTTADDVDEWDSLTHMELIVAIEKHFNVRFASSEILSYNNVGEMCDSIAKKL
jgi:acyl carrier protein